MRRVAQIAAVLVAVAALGILTPTAWAGHHGHHDGHHDVHFYGYPHPRPPVVVVAAPVPAPVYSYYPAYGVVPAPYYVAPYPVGGAVTLQGRHVGITFGF